MNNVFVTNFKNQPGMVGMTDDIRKANGRLIGLTEGKVNVFNTDNLKSNVLYELDINEFDPATDYILIAGNSIIAAVVMKVIADTWPDRKIRVLLYDHRDLTYVERKI